nr:uncharacterized protein LOC115263445 isoform X1 [Aedes albopictus]
MDAVKFLRHSWHLFVAQEEVGPWQHLWRRIKFFFYTDENFRSESLVFGALVVTIGFLALVIPWECAKRYRRRNNIAPQTAIQIMEQLEDNRECLREIAHLLTQPKNLRSPSPEALPEAIHETEQPPSLGPPQVTDVQAADGPVQCKIPVCKLLRQTTMPVKKVEPKKARSTPK